MSIKSGIGWSLKIRFKSPWNNDLQVEGKWFRTLLMSRLSLLLLSRFLTFRFPLIRHLSRPWIMNWRILAKVQSNAVKLGKKSYSAMHIYSNFFSSIKFLFRVIQSSGNVSSLRSLIINQNSLKLTCARFPAYFSMCYCQEH